MMRCFCPPERLEPRSETMVLNLSGRTINKIPQLSGINGFFQRFIGNRIAKGNILPDAHIENDAILENKTHLAME